MRPLPKSRTRSILSYLRAQARIPRRVASLAIVGLILGLAGPFGTISFVQLPGRLVYWLALVFLLAPLGTFLSLWLTAWLTALRLPPLLAAGLGGFIAGPALTLVIFSFNHLTIGRPFPPPNALTLGLSFAVVTAALNMALALGSRGPTPTCATPAFPAQTPAQTPPTPRLHLRLRHDLRAPILSLRATGHYTEVTTAHGTQTVLLRLADAILESAPTDGLQVHRSHWVSRQHIAALRRDGGRIILTLTDGRDIPVSRTYEQAAEQAARTAAP